MKTNKVDENKGMWIVVTLLLAFVALGTYFAWGTIKENLTTAAESVDQHTGYQSFEDEQVEFALTEEYVKTQIGTSTITHQSRNKDTFYYQGTTTDGYFMMIVQRNASGTLETISAADNLFLD
jgi:hypothetical protein